MKKMFLVPGAAIVLIGVVAVIVIHKNNTKTPIHQTQIQITASGFSPDTIVIKAGTQVVWKNVDTAPHSVASNPFPGDTSVPGLHSRTILPQGSYTYTPTKTSTIGYHDDTQPTHNGIIKVGK